MKTPFKQSVFEEILEEIRGSLDEEETLFRLAAVMGILFLVQGVALFIYGLISSVSGGPMVSMLVYKFGGRGYSSALGLVEHLIALCHMAVILGAALCDMVFEKTPKFVILFFVMEFMGCGLLKLIELVGSYSPILIIVFAVIFVVTVPISGVLITSTLVPTLLIIPGLGAAIMSAVCGIVLPVLSVVIVLQAFAELLP